MALALSPLGHAVDERLGLAWLFSARGPVSASADVVVVALDRRSAERLDLAEKIRDWPRGLYASLVKGLTESGAPVIAFDLILERARDPDHDRALVQAIGAAGRVVLFEVLALQRQPVPAAGNQALGLLETQHLRPPIDAFAEAAAGLGPFPLPIVPDRVSQVWLFQPGAGGRATLPAVALQQRALLVYDDWLALLKRAQAHGISALPHAARTIRTAADLRRAMTGIRGAFRADPSLGERMRRAIADGSFAPPSERLLLALTDLYAGPDSRYLNFYGPAGQIRTVSLADALAGAGGDPAAWQGKAVFVGQSELHEPHSDAFLTVYSRPDGVNIAGVEIAATVYANLLDGRLLDPSPRWLLIVAAFGLAIGVVATLLPALWAAPACLALAALYGTGAVLAFAATHIWLPITTPLLAELPLGLFAGLFLQYREARRARENLSRAIRYYLPDRLAEGFSYAPEAPLKEDEEAYAYCLITDASGFTTLAEKMASRELKPFLESYLAILFEAVETHGGRVTDSVGDGITAAFTANQPDPAVAARACQAALMIDREVQRFNQRHDPLRLPTRIGLNAGRVTLGHVGGAGRFTYTVVGDAVNTASRIEQLNKHLGTRILATKAVVEGVPDLALRPLGRFQLFGKEEILEIVEIFVSNTFDHGEALLEHFSVALAKFREQHWGSAADGFAQIVVSFEDGAARFYLETCRQYLKLPILSRELDIVRLDTK